MSSPLFGDFDAHLVDVALEGRGQISAPDSGEAQIILNFVGLAKLFGQIPAAQQQHFFIADRGRDGGGQPRRARADNGDVVTAHRISSKSSDQ